MTRFMNVRNMIAATVLGMATLFGSVGSAACDSYYTPAVHYCSYKKVVTYEYKRIPVTKWIIAYDAYGCAHKVRKTFYKTIKIPVVSYVKVYH